MEYLSKRVAKDVASQLNSTPVAGKKRSKAHGVLWNIKFLPRFKWTHLTERMALEKAVAQSRMRAEVGRARREAEHFRQGVEKGKRMEKGAKRKRAEGGAASEQGDKKAKVSSKSCH